MTTIIREIPDIFTLKTLMHLLYKDKFCLLQHLPHKNHSVVYMENELLRLAAMEIRLIKRFDQKEPIIYEHSLYNKYYSNRLGIGIKQKLLADVFLYNNVLPRQEIKRSLPEYFNIIRDFLEKKDDKVQFPFRIIPFFQFMLLADTLDYASYDRVFFYRDSCLLASYLRRKKHIPKTVADVGTGTGCLSLIAASLGASKVLAVDINPRAIAFAKLNVMLNGFDHAITVSEGSIDDVTKKRKTIECIISNPPYMFIESSDEAYCINGGDYFGMEFPLKLVKISIKNGVRIIMIIAVPIAKKRNEFERHLSKNNHITEKEVIEVCGLYDQIDSLRPLIKAGFTHREVSIYNIAKAIH